jgi:hypothetical protein
MSWSAENGMIRLGDPTSQEAKASGIRKGDVLVAVDGKRVGSDLASAGEIDRMLIRPEGATARLTTRSPDGKLSDHRLTRLERHLDEQLDGTGISSRAYVAATLVTNLLPDLVLLIAGAALFVRGRRQEAVPAALALALVLMAATGPGAYYFYVSMPQGREILAGIAIAMLVAAMAAFPHGRYEPRWSGLVPFAALVLAIVTALAPFLFRWIDAGWTFLLVVAIAAVVHRYRGLGAGADRQQIRWVLFGFACGTLLLVATVAADLLLDQLSPRSPERLWAELGVQVLRALAFGFMALGMLVSLFRYRLYDADRVISRSVAYGAVTVSVLAVFAGSGIGRTGASAHTSWVCKEACPCSSATCARPRRSSVSAPPSSMPSRSECAASGPLSSPVSG